MIKNGKTCQFQVNMENISKKCSSDAWKNNKYCGQTCAANGYTTDPSCNTGKYFNVNLRATHIHLT